MAERGPESTDEARPAPVMGAAKLLRWCWCLAACEDCA
jgi:hypothetical protein